MNDLELIRDFRSDVPDPHAADRAARIALDSLRAQMDAPPRAPARRRRPRRRVTVALAGTLALLGIGAVVLDGSDSGLTPAPSDALAITRQADWIELRIANNSATAEQMTRDLNAAGIRGRVELVPVPADYVGVWILTSEAARPTTCIPAPGQRSRERVRLQDIERIPEASPRALRIPVIRVRESTGSFLFVAGRPAKPGEQPIDAGSIEAQDALLETLQPTPSVPRRLPRCGD
jgi:hypothetical protein